MPLLEVEGKLIGQSIAIARFIAREYGRVIMSENVNDIVIPPVEIMHSDWITAMIYFLMSPSK